MRNRFLVSVVAGAAFAIAAGVAPRSERSGASRSLRVPFTYPTPAYAAGTCSLAPLVCANDSAPGCEVICAGEQQAACVEGSCSPAGNIVKPNQCACK